MEECADITSLHDYIYTATDTTIELYYQTLSKNNNRKTTMYPIWEIRLDCKVLQTRKEIGILQHTTKLLKKENDKFEKYISDKNKNTEEVLNYSKQLQIVGKRLCRYRHAHRTRTDKELYK